MMESRKHRIYPTNPLGIIALFVFFIEAISTFSLKILADTHSEYVSALVYFIILFPSAIAVMFFLTLWCKREALFAPGDFKDESNFLSLFPDNSDPIALDLNSIFSTIAAQKASTPPNTTQGKKLNKVERSFALSAATLGVQSNLSPENLGPIIKKLESLPWRKPLDPQVASYLTLLYRRVGKVKKAISILSEVLSLGVQSESLSKKEQAHFLYNLACYNSLLSADSDKDKFTQRALAHLKRAIDINEKYKRKAQTDPDFDPIRNSGEFIEVIS
ncbi:tetratricopeptide repeat protein [Aliikangiella coralliicola]|uniref:Tetratricopeptide repeat protein n=1 Tax=Aliikangiella coralliicola TaxID=2592383 RepID=A0A545U4J0_9GAMM|nr:tetratricopeptide repeat protein [Aliikangiella coralliicola]TQV84395.1 tetratricopeptide repeat protein [Aliikangiella coralliicola]